MRQPPPRHKSDYATGTNDNQYILLTWWAPHRKIEIINKLWARVKSRCVCRRRKRGCFLLFALCASAYQTIPVLLRGTTKRVSAFNVAIARGAWSSITICFDALKLRQCGHTHTNNNKNRMWIWRVRSRRLCACVCVCVQVGELEAGHLRQIMGFAPAARGMRTSQLECDVRVHVSAASERVRVQFVNIVISTRRTNVCNIHFHYRTKCSASFFLFVVQALGNAGRSNPVSGLKCVISALCAYCVLVSITRIFQRSNWEQKQLQLNLCNVKI